MSSNNKSFALDIMASNSQDSLNSILETVNRNGFQVEHIQTQENPLDQGLRVHLQLSGDSSVSQLQQQLQQHREVIEILAESELRLRSCFT